jgi:hypothetical protein
METFRLLLFTTLWTAIWDHDRTVAVVRLLAEKALEWQAVVKRVGHREGLQQPRLHAQHLGHLVGHTSANRSNHRPGYPRSTAADAGRPLARGT